MRHLRIQAFALVGLVAAACASAPETQIVGPVISEGEEAPITVQKIGRPYQINGRWYTPARQDNYDEIGQASWYGDEFHGRPTANGERFDMNRLTAAHPTLPIPSYVQVTNLDNGRTAILRVNDRGPFARNRIMDVSRRAAEELGFLNRGTANVRVTYLGPKENELGVPGRLYTASADVSPAPVSTAPISVNVGQAPAPAPAGAISVEPMSRLEPEEPAPTVQPTPDPALSAGGWFVQAGAFSEPGRAESARARLVDLGPAQIETISVAGQTLHRVLVGPYPAELAANAARYQVAGAGFGDARLVLRN